MSHNTALQNKVCIQYYQPAASLGQQIFANLKYQVIEESKLESIFTYMWFISKYFQSIVVTL